MAVEETTEIGESEKIPVILWLVAGIPVVTGLFQGIAAIFGFSWSEQPVVGPGARLIHEFEPFRAASSMPMEAGALIALLFIQVGVCWVLFGLTLSSRLGIANYGKSADGLRSGTAFLVGLLYLNLFIGVYGGIADEIGTISLALFFSIPFIVVASIGSSWYLFQPRGPVQDLQQAKSQIREHILTFEKQADQLQAGIELLQDLGAGDNQIEGITDDVKRYSERLHEIEKQIDEEMATAPVSATSARTLRIRAKEQNPKERFQEYRKRVANYAVDLMKQEHRNFSKVSRYGEEYELVNHKNSLYLDPYIADIIGEDELHIEELPGFIETTAETEDIQDEEFYNLLRELGKEYQEITVEIDEKEEEFARRKQSIVSNLDEFKEKIDTGLPKNVASKMQKIYFPNSLDGEGLVDQVETEKDVQDRLRRAQDALHKCSFDKAFDLIEEAETIVKDYLLLAEDISGIVNQIRNGQKSTTVIPSDTYDSKILTDEVFTELEEAIKKEYDMSAELSGNKIGTNSNQSKETEEVINTKTGTEVEDPEILNEDGESFFNQVRLIAGQDGEHVDKDGIAIRKSDLPSHLQRREVLEMTEQFLTEQPQISSASVLDAGENPVNDDDLIEIESNGNKPIQQVLKTLPAKFANWADQTQPNP